MRKKGFLGYPEPDGGIPFAVSIDIEQGFFLVVGVVNRGQKLYSDIQSTIDSSTEKELELHLKDSGLFLVDFSDLYWLLDVIFDGSKPFEEYELISLNEGSPKMPFFRKGDYDPLSAMNVTALMSPKEGMFFSVPDEILSDGIKGLQLAMRNKEEIRQSIIDAVVDSCAELAIDDESRWRWSNALDAISIIYSAQEKSSLMEVAQNNRRALDIGAAGSQIPFVRNWVNQQLLNSAAVAQLIARDEIEGR